jgi:large subunit ribosomal protein L3
MKALIGIKKGMTRVFKENKVIPVTILDTKGCVLSHMEPQGFELGIGEKKNPSKAMQGKYKAVKKYPLFRRYFKGSLPEDLKLGDEVKVETFSIGDKVTVSGVSKGKGFTGVVKRWGFSGGPKTHGQSDRHRAGGSIGAGTDPGRVLKGKKMPGRMGQDRVTLKDKEIMGIQDGLILIAGPIPGSKGSVVAIYQE